MTDDGKSRRKALGDEIRSPGYLARARARAGRRRSPWNLVLIPLAVAGIGIAYPLLLHLVFAFRHLVQPHAASLREFVHADCRSVPATLAGVGPFFAAIPIGLMLCNAVAWMIPPARAVFVHEAEGVWHASFHDAQRDLLVLAQIIVPVGLAIGLAGALFLHCPR